MSSKINDYNKRIQLKSFFYKLSSINVGYNVYQNEEDQSKIFLEKLICSNPKCEETWETSDTECFYCGTPNYFLYTCLNCGYKFSITIKDSICPNCKHKNTLKQLCLNPNCPTNDKINYPYLYNESRKGTGKKGGVFNSNKGLSIRQNSCKYCGNRINEYKSSELKVVFNHKQLKQDLYKNNNIDEVYMERNSPTSPVNIYYFIHNNKEYNTKDIKKLAEKITSSNIKIQ